MMYFIILVSGFGLLMLSCIIYLCKEAGELNKQIEIDKERDKQLKESKDNNLKSDEELLEWLEKQKKKEGK